MDITFLGHSSFKIKTKLGTLVAGSSVCEIEGSAGTKKTLQAPVKYEFLEFRLWIPLKGEKYDFCLMKQMVFV